MSWIQTFSGKKFDLLNPTPAMVDPVDIAHALSMICRFTGHTIGFYSVAEHSLRVAQLVPHMDVKQALLHDATEAYIQDISSPLKQLLPDYKAIERRIHRAICDRFDLCYALPESVKRADLLMLRREREDLMGRPPEPWHESIENLDISKVATISEPARPVWVIFEKLMLAFEKAGIQ